MKIQRDTDYRADDVLTRRMFVQSARGFSLAFLALAPLCWSAAAFVTPAAAAAQLPAVDAALAAQVSDQAHKDWDPDAELIQIAVTAAGDGHPDGVLSAIPVVFIFRANGKGYEMTLSREGSILGAPTPLPPNATEPLPITFIALKDALTLARAKGFGQTGDLHPVLQSFASTDGLRKIGWLFAAPGDSWDKQIFVTADGHQVGTVQGLFGSLRQ